MLDNKINNGGVMWGFGLNNGTHIPFRCLSYGEFKSISTTLQAGVITPQAIWQWVTDKCVLDPAWASYVEVAEAGLTQTLGELILLLSGPSDFGTLNHQLNQARELTGSVEFQMKSAVCRVYPGYTMESLDKLVFENLLQVFAQAERVLLETGQITEPFQINDPSAPLPQDEPVPGQKHGVVSDAEIAKLNAALGKM